MKAKLLLVVLLAILLGVTFAAGAQDEGPAESPEDNACYAGGSLEGKCDWPTDAEDEWAWHCGWYIARVDTGEFAVSDVPEWCNYFVEVTTTDCYSAVGQLDFRLTGPLNTLLNATGYFSFDGSCSGAVSPSQETIVTAPFSEAGRTEAEGKCAELTGGAITAAAHLATELGYNTPENWWACYDVSA